MLLVLTGCAQNTNETQETAAAHEREYTAGALTVAVTLDRLAFDITETGTLSITVTTPEGWQLDMPELTEALKPHTLAVLETRRDEDALDADGNVVRTMHYELEGVVVGTHELGALTITAQPKTEEIGQEIVTEPITIDVQPLAADVDREEAATDATEERTLRDIKGPIPLAGPTAWRRWMIVGGAAVVVLVAILLLWRRRRTQREKRREYRLAHDIALAALRQLELERLVQTGQVKAHYEQLSSILRRYIEHRFLLEAPEQTTEEFLAAAYSDVTLSEEHRTLMREFLEHCDLVKFARYAPQQEQIQRSGALAERFVHITRSTEALVDVTDGLPGFAVREDNLAQRTQRHRHERVV